VEAAQLNPCVAATDSTETGDETTLRIQEFDRENLQERDSEEVGSPDAPKPSSEETFIVSGAPESLVDYAFVRPNSQMRFSKIGRLF
jgi:hypothetical protein